MAHLAFSLHYVDHRRDRKHNTTWLQAKAAFGRLVLMMARCGRTGAKSVNSGRSQPKSCWVDGVRLVRMEKPPTEVLLSNVRGRV